MSASEEDNPGKGLVRAKLLCIGIETDQAKLPSTQALILFLPGDWVGNSEASFGRGGQHTTLRMGAEMEAQKREGKGSWVKWNSGDCCNG